MSNISDIIDATLKNYKGIIALLVFMGINGGWFLHSQGEAEYTSKVEKQVTELAGMVTRKQCEKPAINCLSQPY